MKRLPADHLRLQGDSFLEHEQNRQVARSHRLLVYPQEKLAPGIPTLDGLVASYTTSNKCRFFVAGLALVGSSPPEEL